MDQCIVQTILASDRQLRMIAVLCKEIEPFKEEQVDFHELEIPELQLFFWRSGGLR
jgi:hypothetical protein